MTDLVLVGLANDLLEHVAVDPRLVASLSASYVTLDLTSDAEDDILTTALAVDGGAGVIWDDRRFVLAGVRSAAARVRVVFEDAVIASLRAQREPLMIPAGSTTRPELVKRLATEAGVDFDVEATRSLVPHVVRRIDSWSTLASLGWECFSDGDQVVVGSREWLAIRAEAVEAEADTGEVRDVDVSLWTNKAASEATLLVEEAWEGWPGDPVLLPDVDDEVWLVESRTMRADAATATVVLTRGPWIPGGVVPWP